MSTPRQKPIGLTTRGFLAAFLLLIVFVVVVFGFIRAKTWEQYKDFLNIILPILTGFTGSALGYYYGQKQPERGSRTTQQR